MRSKFTFNQILPVIFIFSLLLGCESNLITEENQLEIDQSEESNQAQTNDNECPEKPEKLDPKNVEKINLNDEGTTVSDQLTASEALGYTFRGEEGQKLMYSTEEELCMWVYTPDNELLEGLELPTDGSYTVQISIPQGAKTFELGMVLREPNFSSGTSAKTNNPSNNSSNFNSNTDSSLDSEKAVQLIREWQQAKRQIFAPPYDRRLGEELLTGQAYAKRIRQSDGSESSVDWLENNNAYYTYRSQAVDEVNHFQSLNDSAFLDVVISEARTLCLDSKAVQDNTAQDKMLVRYDFQYVEGKWKILGIETKDVINRRDNPNPSCRIIN